NARSQPRPPHQQFQGGPKTLPVGGIRTFSSTSAPPVAFPSGPPPQWHQNRSSNPDSGLDRLPQPTPVPEPPPAPSAPGQGEPHRSSPTPATWWASRPQARRSPHDPPVPRSQ